MSDADVAAFDKVNEATMADKSAPPGMWIGVWDPKKGWHIGGYGEAVMGGAKATDADHGRIGSVTKTFTATAILQQVAAGKLALTDTVGTLLPDLAAKYPDVAPITVEQLLSMRSGIPDYIDSGLLTQQFLDHPERVWTADEIIAAVLEKTKVDPSVAEYSNTNYLILGEILRKVTGQAPDVVITSVAAALGLNDTALPAPAETAMPAPASAGYILDAGVASLKEAGGTAKSGTTVQDATPSWGAAAGGMYSTVADLGAWGAAASARPRCRRRSATSACRAGRSRPADRLRTRDHRLGQRLDRSHRPGRRLGGGRGLQRQDRRRVRGDGQRDRIPDGRGPRHDAVLPGPRAAGVRRQVAGAASRRLGTQARSTVISPPAWDCVRRRRNHRTSRPGHALRLS